MTEAAHAEFARLAQRVANERDRAAFETLFHHFAPRLNGYLQRLGLGAGEAEDIVQDVMSVLWNKAHLFDPKKSSLATWLFRVARNRRIDGIRRGRSQSLDPYDPMLSPEPVEEPGKAIDGQRRDVRVRAALDALSAEQREMLSYAYFKGLTQAQIAETTGVPLGTVKSRVRLAFARLKTILEQDPQIDTD